MLLTPDSATEYWSSSIEPEHIIRRALEQVKDRLVQGEGLAQPMSK
jgi:hypothetical protein